MQRQGTRSDFSQAENKKTIAFYHSNSMASVGSKASESKSRKNRDKPTSIEVQMAYDKQMKRKSNYLMKN